ncbi:hypothetical protein [Vibrio phage J14]|nr:hypothetical protein [Vibrio phage J14]
MLLAKDGTPLFMKYLDAKYLRLMEYGDQDNETVQTRSNTRGQENKSVPEDEAPPLHVS